MKKIIFTRVEDSGVNIVVPMPKHDIERILGDLTDSEYEDHVWDRSVPEDAINARVIDDEDIPTTREFRNAWCDATPESRIDIDLSKAKDIQLEKLRLERQKAFVDLGFPQKLNPEVENAIVSPETKEKLKALRDATEPLKALVVEGYNDEAILQKIRELGKLNY